jgi:hypothetical protein
MTDVEPKTPTRRRMHKPRGLGHAKATAGDSRRAEGAAARAFVPEEPPMSNNRQQPSGGGGGGENGAQGPLWIDPGVIAAACREPRRCSGEDWKA